MKESCNTELINSILDMKEEVQILEVYTYKTSFKEISMLLIPYNIIL
jgi:hypothetical protein